MTRAPVRPDLMRWARDRAGRTQADLAARFEKLPEWEAGAAQPTLKQAEAFARAVHVPFGYLFLAEPPDESVPIPDFRTLAGRAPRRPSPNLLDTIYACQQRQSWYRDHARVEQHSVLSFVVSVTLATTPAVVAGRMRQTLGFDTAAQRSGPRWIDALRPTGRQRVPRLHPQRPPGPAGLRERRRCEGSADAHARARARASLARSVGAVVRRRGAGAGLADPRDAWRMLQDFMRFCNIVDPPAIRRGLFT